MKYVSLPYFDIYTLIYIGIALRQVAYTKNPKGNFLTTVIHIFLNKKCSFLLTNLIAAK